MAIKKHFYRINLKSENLNPSI